MYLTTLNSMINTHRTTQRAYPLLIGCGKFDIPMELEAIKMWKNSEPNCKTVIFDHAGHCVNMDVPQAFNEVTNEFLANAELNE